MIFKVLTRAILQANKYQSETRSFEFHSIKLNLQNSLRYNKITI